MAGERADAGVRGIATEDEFRGWVARQDWVFAKTMPHIPHEYVVRGRAPGWQEAADYVQEAGHLARWRTKPPNKYVELDGHRYWVIEMILNRGRIGDPGNTDRDLCWLE